MYNVLRMLLEYLLARFRFRSSLLGGVRQDIATGFDQKLKHLKNTRTRRWIEHMTSFHNVHEALENVIGRPVKCGV